MPQIVTPQGAPIAYQPLQPAFQPLQIHQWTPADFEGAYQYGPKPVDPNAMANSVVSAFQGGQKIGQGQQQLDQSQQTIDLDQEKWDSAAPQRNLANQLSDQEASDERNARNAKPGPLSGMTANGPAATPSSVDADSVGTGGSLTPTTTDPAAFGNAGAPDANGYHLALGTGFGGNGDLARYNAAKASGATEAQALAVGDNGIGKWGANTAGNVPLVALAPQIARAYGLDPNQLNGQLVQASYGGKTVTAKVGDVLPDNSKNGSAIDLNPAALNQLGVDDADNFKDKVAFRLLASNPDSSPSILPGGPSNPAAVGAGATLGGNGGTAAPIAGTTDTYDANNDGGALSRAMASVDTPADRFARQQNVLANVTAAVPPRVANPLAQLVASPNGGNAMLGVVSQPSPSQVATAPLAQLPLAVTAPANPQPLAQAFMPPPGSLADVMQRLHGPGTINISNGAISYAQPTPLNPLQAQLTQAEINAAPLHNALLAAQTQAAQIAAQKAGLGLPGSGPVPATPVIDPATNRVLEYMTPSGSVIAAAVPGTQSLLTDAANHQVDPTPFKNPDGSYNADAIRAAIAQKTAGNTQDMIKAKNAYDTALASYNSMKAYIAKPPAQRTAADDANFMQAAAHVEVPDRASTHADMQALQGTGSTMDKIKTELSGLPGMGPKRLLTDDQAANMFSAAGGSVEQRRLLVQQALQGGTASLTSQSVLPGGTSTAAAPGSLNSPVATAAPAAQGSRANPVAVTSAQQYASLPSGTYYADSTGRVARKP